MRSSLNKWEQYYAAGSVPWDSRTCSSQLRYYLTDCPKDLRLAKHFQVNLSDIRNEDQYHVCCSCQCLKPPRESTALEIGCGTGESSLFMAHLGWKVVAIDVVEEVICTCTARALELGLQEKILFETMDYRDLRVRLPDMLSTLGLETSSSQLEESNLASCDPGGYFDFIYDCQTFHVLREEGEKALVELLHGLLKPGGYLFLLVGNANEPHVGPNVLSASQLHEAFPSTRFDWMWLVETRFDPTEHYLTKLDKLPLAWWALLRKSNQPLRDKSDA